MAPRNTQRQPPRRRARRLPRSSLSSSVIVPRPFAWGVRRCTLVYSGGITLNAGIGTSAMHVFVANGLYDPDYTSTGHQPYSFDEIMAVYNHYTVLAASATVRPNAPGADVNVAYGITISGSANDLSGLSPDTLIEHPGTQSWKTLSRYGNQLPVSASIQLPRFFGATNIVGKEPYVGTAAANPVEQAFFTVWAGGLGSSDPPATVFVVKIIFDVVFTEPRTLNSS